MSAKKVAVSNKVKHGAASSRLINILNTIQFGKSLALPRAGSSDLSAFFLACHLVFWYSGAELGGNVPETMPGIVRPWRMAAAPYFCVLENTSDRLPQIMARGYRAEVCTVHPQIVSMPVCNQQKKLINCEIPRLRLNPPQLTVTNRLIALIITIFYCPPRL